MGHHGVRKTWLALTKHFPGHRIPIRLIEDLISRCAICQKHRLGIQDALMPVYRTLKPDSKRKRVGVDTLTITPVDKFGNKYLTVIVVHSTKLVDFYPSASKDALSTAVALFQFFATYSVYDEIISYPGSDLVSEVEKHLTMWYDIRHIFGLVDRHESNGVEGTNQSILEHLKALITDERCQDTWSSPSVLFRIKYILNSQVSSETGIIPYEVHFGSDNATYMRMPEVRDVSESTHAFVKLLDDNLRHLCEVSKAYQSKLVKKREKGQDMAKQNQYQLGDLVLFRRPTGVPLPTKLSMKFMGAV